MWSLNYGSLIDCSSSSSLRSALSVVRVSYLCIARKWCVRRGVIAIRVLASVCRASLCSAAEPHEVLPPIVHSSGNKLIFLGITPVAIAPGGSWPVLSGVARRSLG